MQNGKMKKRTWNPVHLLRPIVFALIFIALLVPVSYILRYDSGSSSRQNICGFYAEKENSLDVVLIGSSSIFAFWEPMKFWEDYGVASYDFATGQFPVQLTRACIEEIRKTQDPKLFVVDVRPYTYAEYSFLPSLPVSNMYHDTAIRNVTDNLKYSLQRERMIEEGLPPEYDSLPYHLDIMKYHTQWDRLVSPDAYEYVTNCRKNGWKGFYTVDNMKRPDYTDYSAEEGRLPLSENLDRILTDLLEYCRKEELEVLFLVNVHEQGREQKQIYNYISDRVSDYNYELLNTNDKMEEIGLDLLTDFYDRYHVNLLGAEKYTAYVENWIMDHYNLPDHRKEPGYTEWNDDLTSWHEETGDLIEKLEKRAAKRRKKAAEKALETEESGEGGI